MRPLRHDIAKPIHGRDLRVHRDADQHIAVRQMLRLVQDRQKFGACLDGFIGSFVSLLGGAAAAQEAYEKNIAAIRAAAAEARGEAI